MILKQGEVPGISPKKTHSLKGLFRRFTLGVGLSLLGAWLIASIRLNMVRTFFSLNQHEGICFFLEMIFFALTLFGLFTAISALPELRTRINRIDALGERDW